MGRAPGLSSDHGRCWHRGLLHEPEPLTPADCPQGICATFLCQPLDVIKTRLMNSHGEYQVRSPSCPLGTLAAASQHCLMSPSCCRALFTVPWKLPSSALSPSTRYPAGDARGGWCLGRPGRSRAEVKAQGGPGPAPWVCLCLPAPGLALECPGPWTPPSLRPQPGHCSRCPAAPPGFPDRSTGMGSGAAALPACDRPADTAGLLGPTCQVGAGTPVSSSAPGRAPEEGFHPRSFPDAACRVCSRVQSRGCGSAGAVGPPGLLLSLCLRGQGDNGFAAEGLMHGAKLCVHGDGRGASPPPLLPLPPTKPPSSPLCCSWGLSCCAPSARHTPTVPVLAVSFQGFVPAAIRLVPQTVLTFIFLEQLRKYFGIKVTT